VLLLLLSSIGTTSLYIKWLINDAMTNPLRRTTTSLPEVVRASKYNTIMHQARLIVKYGKPRSQEPSRPRWRPPRAGWSGREPETALAPFFRPSASRLDMNSEVSYTSL
jgi:hypothetical protein